MVTTGIAIATVTADAGYAYAQGVWGHGAAWDRRGDPGEGRPNAQRRSVAAVQVRSENRHGEVSAGHNPDPRQGPKAWQVLHGPRSRLPILSACRPVPAERTDSAGGHDQHRLSSPATSSATPGSLVRRGPAALQAPQVALGRIPRGGKDLAWPGARRPPRHQQHEDP